MEIAELRSEIDRLMLADAASAARALAQLWRRDAGPSLAGFVVSRFEKMRNSLPLVPFRLALLRSFTVEPVAPLLRAAAFTGGIDLTVHLGDFNAYAQEILDADSALYRFQPDAVILAVQTGDVAPDLWRQYGSLTGAGSPAAVARVAGQFRDWVRAFREHSQAHLILHTLELPLIPSRGMLDGQSELSQAEDIQQINRDLRSIARASRGVYILDYDALVARYGRIRWRDDRKWLTLRMPVTADHLIHLANEWMRFLHPLSGKVAKALAVDLDNTLWGGIIGEEGMAGIQLGTEYPGAAYRELQQAMLELYGRGILLAVCSKNNPDDALEALHHHPGMLLRPQHFAAMRINWKDKTQNLREIAAELNIGIDTLAFLDDNPVERKRIGDELPEVTVIDLPPDPMRYAQALRDSPVFERLTLSKEDCRRGEYYAAQQQRQELERSVSTREDFYRALRQEAEIAPLAPATLSRVAQLTQKTNQFNLTTRRYTEQEIAEMTPVAGWRVYSIRVSDCYQDNGLVGVAITRDTAGVCEIDTFLLSCRVIGRTVETALLWSVVSGARSRGMQRVQGWFRPTKKNAPARDFYPQHGFHAIRQNGDGTLWALDLARGDVACPEWIKATVAQGE